ncbi:MAG TPA: hypothetical protein V6D08_13100 [Candidatus Obscuribacterales bacterium]
MQRTQKSTEDPVNTQDQFQLLINLAGAPKQLSNSGVETAATGKAETDTQRLTPAPPLVLAAQDLLAFFCPESVAGLADMRDEQTTGSVLSASEARCEIPQPEPIIEQSRGDERPEREPHCQATGEPEARQADVVVAEAVTGPWEATADSVRSPELEILLSKLQEAQRQLQAASYRIGCLEHQISKHEESRLLLPDLEAQAARAAALARENEELRKLVPYLETRANRLPVVQRENEELRRRLEELKAQKSKAWWDKVVRFLTGRRGGRAVELQEGGRRFAGQRRDREGRSSRYSWAEQGRATVASQYEVVEAWPSRR